MDKSGEAARGLSGHAGFFEIDSGQMAAAERAKSANGGCSISIERPDGWRLSLSNASESMVLEALCGRFFGIDDGIGGTSEMGR
ncbi:MAG TPA: hypothetical protein VEZ90_20145 [Blastocatellia bacterium]|nr:hypothetical protein [Blastocatellia bacterium]